MPRQGSRDWFTSSNRGLLSALRLGRRGLEVERCKGRWQLGQQHGRGAVRMDWLDHEGAGAQPCGTLDRNCGVRPAEELRGDLRRRQHLFGSGGCVCGLPSRCWIGHRSLRGRLRHVRDRWPFLRRLLPLVARHCHCAIAFSLVRGASVAVLRALRVPTILTANAGLEPAQRLDFVAGEGAGRDAPLLILFYLRRHGPSRFRRSRLCRLEREGLCCATSAWPALRRMGTSRSSLCRLPHRGIGLRACDSELVRRGCVGPRCGPRAEHDYGGAVWHDTAHDVDRRLLGRRPRIHSVQRRGRSRD
mmetsp:Transcript_30597/g.88681  ORF Transcript_30597/g.88681 Transcript_30597/m.88681 type:complete len:303 (+) Transcript_30597:865-1773(+)